MSANQKELDDARKIEEMRKLLPMVKELEKMLNKKSESK